MPPRPTSCRRMNHCCRQEEEVPPASAAPARMKARMHVK